MTRLIVDGRECADAWDHLAGDEAPGGGSFAGTTLARTTSELGKGATAPGRRSFTEGVAAIAPDGSAAGGGGTPSVRGFTVDLARWLAQRHDLIAHAGRTGQPAGVRLATGDDPMRLADDTERFALIVIEIPSAADGRFYSIAARLREHLHYRHELRATGDVAPDQLSFMQRCGVNAFEIGDHVDIERFIRRYRRFYQSSGPLTTRDNQIRLARRHARPGGRTPFEDREPERPSGAAPRRLRGGPAQGPAAGCPEAEYSSGATDHSGSTTPPSA